MGVSGEHLIRIHTIRMLGQMIFPGDKELTCHLDDLAHDKDIYVRQMVKDTRQSIQQASNI
jgi:hypothetical protein